MTEDKSADIKAKMLAALEKKQKKSTSSNSEHSQSANKLGSGQQTGGAPKMHRRKSGSA
ncbi:MAG: DUF5302 family protein [Candidatus Fonsibacter sp.]